MLPVVHFEIIGTDPDRLREFYRQLFDWNAADAPVAPEVSDTQSYGFIEPSAGGPAAAGGIGGGVGFPPHTIFYVGVDDIEQTLARAEQLGGTRVMGPVTNDAGAVVVGHFTDPEGNLIGVAAAA